MDIYDAIIIGAGTGGLVAGALLANEGAKVLLLEQSNNVGGCAATFSYKGYRFDAGATIGCGFHHGGPMQWLADRLHLDWPVRPLPVAWEYREGETRIALDQSRDSVLDRFPSSQPFWKTQAEIADRLWELTDAILSQYNRKRIHQLKTLASHLSRKIITPKVIRTASRPAGNWLKQYGLHRDREFRRFIDAQLLISAQTTAARCNALFAALALDLPRRSPVSITGGIGTIADILRQAISQGGGRVHLREKVVSLTTHNRRIDEVTTSKAKYRGKEIIINGSSATLAPLLGKYLSSSWQKTSRAQWGAFILHMGINQKNLDAHETQHLQLVRSDSDALAEGDSLFLSLSHPSDRSLAPYGKRALTVSTHTEVKPWWDALNSGEEIYQQRKTAYTEKVLDLMSRYLPGIVEDMDFCLAGTPVTYSRYTGRHLGLVGGYVQTSLFPPRQKVYGLKNCTLVGDHRFPGQSIAGVTVGSAMVADHLLRHI